MNAGQYLVRCCHQPLEMEMEFEIRLHMSELLRGYNISASSTVSHVTDIGSSLYLICSHICAFLHLCVFSHATPSFAHEVAPFLQAGTERIVVFSVHLMLTLCFYCFH